MLCMEQKGSGNTAHNAAISEDDELVTHLNTF